MEVDLFLFGIALVYVIFATFQDLKKREVANWLTYSFVVFALAYRAFYAIAHNQLSFFWYGLFGTAIFFCIANLAYYGKIFAGGDAKLLIGFGAVLPFENLIGFATNSIIFLFALFSFGAIYCLIFSFGLSIKNFSKFSKEIIRQFPLQRKRILSLNLIAICLILLSYILFGNYFGFYLISCLLVVMPWLHFYLKVLEKSVLIILTDPMKLTEGDWLERDVKVGNKVIHKSVHGLSVNEIKILRKFRRSVYVKQGIPFVPAFFFALCFMAFFFLVLSGNLQILLFSLF